MPLGAPDDALLCGEDAGELEQEDPLCCDAVADELVLPDGSDVSVVGELVVPEDGHLPVAEYPGRLRDRPAERLARSGCVSWVLRVRSAFGFLPATAYLAVSYMDRFLSSRSLPDHKWAFQLLSVACLSLAAKMEESLVPPLLDLQIEGTRFIFEPRTIQRMELLVLAALDWRLRSVTPFMFIHFFACNADKSGRYTRSLVSCANQIILDTIHDIEFFDHCPSSMAAAAVLCAVNETPAMPYTSPEIAVSWCTGLTEEGISSCCLVLQQAALTTSKRKTTVNVRPSPSSVPSFSPSKRQKVDGNLGEQ